MTRSVYAFNSLGKELKNLCSGAAYGMNKDVKI